MSKLAHSQQLPKREADIFKKLMKDYDKKDYRKAIKFADQILKKYPSHGETLAMKGLATYFVLPVGEPKTAAYDLVKKGVGNAMTSHIVWHVYGLLYRQDRDYKGAIKCYKQALRIDKGNLQILRDMATLEVQMRDLAGFEESRHQLLSLKPNLSAHWLSFAVAVHLNSDQARAINILDGFSKDILETIAMGPVERSELAMYRNMILGEIEGKDRECLDHLKSIKSVVVDKNDYIFRMGELHLLLGEHKEAKKVFTKSFKRGVTEDYRVHSGYMCAVLDMSRAECVAACKLRGMETVATQMVLTAAQCDTLTAEYEDLLNRFPRSSAMKRILLTTTTSKKFEELMDKYLRNGLRKGVPSLGADVTALFTVAATPNNVNLSPRNLCMGDGAFVVSKDPIELCKHERYNTVTKLLDSYITCLEESSKLPLESTEEPPSTLLWCYYLRAHLLELIGEICPALEAIEKCIDHTPTAVDIYEKKGRLMKLAGDVHQAADIIDSGRALDKADRYINNKTTKYMLRSGRPEEAENRIAMFTRHESNPTQNLFDMQCSWFELEFAKCMMAKGEIGKALKKFVAVEKHFEDFSYDQFDFHGFCIRKTTLRAYVKMLRFEDAIWGERFYRTAADGIIRCYLHLLDNPVKSDEEEEPDFSKMSATEKKKWKQQQRKKKAKAEKAKEEAENKKKAEAEAKKKKADEGKSEEEKKKEEEAERRRKDNEVVDPDPEGVELCKKEPLAECRRVVDLLCCHAPSDLHTWILKYDVSMRRGKVLLALQALKKAMKIDKTVASADLFSRIVNFAGSGIAALGDKQGPVKEIVVEAVGEFLGGKSALDFVEAKRKSICEDDHVSMRIAVAEALISLKGAEGTDDAITLITNGSLESRGGFRVTNAELLYRAAEKVGTGKGAEFGKACMAKFPKSVFFCSLSCLNGS